MTIHYVFHDADGEIVRAGTTPDFDSLRAKRDAMPGLRLRVFRRWDALLRPGIDRIRRDLPVIGEAIDPPPSIADVKRFADRLLRRTDWMVLRSIEDPTKPAPQDVLDQRAIIRARSNELEAMSPIPADYRDPKYWS